MASVSGEVIIKWAGSTLMTGFDSRGQSLAIGVWKDHEPELKAVKASDLLLMAAAACTAHDVVTILQKQREPLLDLQVICTGDQESEPPFQFTHIHLHYIVEGNCDRSKIERAIQLSEEKYCSVTNTLNKAVDITYDFEIL
jgi:putative redox protein